MSATVNTLGNAFSQVLVASTDQAKEAMRQGCYDYLSSGGFRTSGMMALFGGMNPRPLSLIYHLFAITLSSIGQLLSPFPSPLRIWHSLRLCGVRHYIFLWTGKSLNLSFPFFLVNVINFSLYCKIFRNLILVFLFFLCWFVFLKMWILRCLWNCWFRISRLKGLSIWCLQ